MEFEFEIEVKAPGKQFDVSTNGAGEEDEASAECLLENSILAIGIRLNLLNSGAM